jgi:hypothetical protein
MSYHSREWDRGKESWQDNRDNNWNEGDWGGGRGRGDDDYYDGKRRKYNDGVCSQFVMSPHKH